MPNNLDTLKKALKKAETELKELSMEEIRLAEIVKRLHGAATDDVRGQQFRDAANRLQTVREKINEKKKDIATIQNQIKKLEGKK